QLALVDQQQHEDEHEGQNDSVDHLGQDADFHQLNVGQQNDSCPGDEEQGVQPIEDFGVAEFLAHTRLKTKALADRVSSRDRQDGGGEQGSVEQPGRKEDIGVLSG